ncbi:unnamed protein product [Rhizoctonia solani]|nr:unnamed protein product [Rhizoctonia solani]
MSRSWLDARWVMWRPHPGQGSSDALANWAAKTRATVEWETTLIRQPDNTAIHVVVPKLTCVKCHPLTDAHGATISYPCSDQSQARLLCDRMIEDWRSGYDSAYTVSVMICYRLTRYAIQDCAGQGPNLKAAKSMAAQRILESGHCMIGL